MTDGHKNRETVGHYQVSSAINDAGSANGRQAIDPAGKGHFLAGFPHAAQQQGVT
jgi:hypothetical protein